MRYKENLKTGQLINVKFTKRFYQRHPTEQASQLLRLAIERYEKVEDGKYIPKKSKELYKILNGMALTCNVRGKMMPDFKREEK